MGGEDGGANDEVIRDEDAAELWGEVMGRSNCEFERVPRRRGPQWRGPYSLKWLGGGCWVAALQLRRLEQEVKVVVHQFFLG
jgi:hypothetical protein